MELRTILTHHCQKSKEFSWGKKRLEDGKASKYPGDFRDSWEVECVRALFAQFKSLKILQTLHRNVQGRVGKKNRQKKEAANGNMFFSILIYTFNKKGAK